MLRFPEFEDSFPAFQGMPAEEIAAHICEQIVLAVKDAPVAGGRRRSARA